MKLLLCVAALVALVGTCVEARYNKADLTRALVEVLLEDEKRTSEVTYQEPEVAELTITDVKQCGGENGGTYTAAQRCDHKEDCSEGQDEQGCLAELCPEDKYIGFCDYDFATRNSKCLTNSEICSVDHTVECDDGSDEAECSFNLFGKKSLKALLSKLLEKK